MHATRLLLLFCFMSFSILHPLVAQPLNRSLHPLPINLGSKLLPTTINGDWLVGGTAGLYMGYPAFQPYLALADAEGNLLWGRQLNDGFGEELGQVNSLSEDPLGEVFYVACSISGCDYLVPGVIYMLDKTGQTLWYKMSGQFYDPIATALPNQGVLVSQRGGDLVEWHSMSGDSVTPFDLGDEFSLQMVEMLTTGLHTVALLGRNQVVLTEWMDGEVQATAYLQLQGGKSISRAPTGQLAVLAGEKIYLLDGNLAILQEQDLSSHGSFSKVSCSANRCYVGGQSPEGKYIALALDTELHLQQTIDMGPAYNYPTDLVALETGLVAAGTALPEETAATPYGLQSAFNTSKGSDIFLRSWDVAGNATPSLRNISMEAVTVEEYEFAFSPEGCTFSNEAYMQGAFSGIEVKVRNQGNAPIGRMEINAVFFPCSYICYTQQNFSYSFDGLSLAPGESTTLSFGDVQTWPLPLASTLELCIWASGPDGRLDDDFQNNSACLSIITDIEGPQNPVDGFSIYPNPASSLLEVAFDAPLSGAAEVKVISPLGQCVFREFIGSGQRVAQLQVEDLPAGLYYLTVQIGETIRALPWIKQ